MTMTGRDLIIYILQNHLEDTQVFEDGKFIGFLTVEETAKKYHVGTATVFAWMQLQSIDGIYLDGHVYLPVTFCPKDTPKER